MNIEEVLSRIRPRRKVKGIAAALLPFENNGSIAVDAFQTHLQRTHSAGLTNAVNMDTGYINYLSEEEQQLVLEWTRDALPANTKFVAGAYIDRRDGDVVTLYRKKFDHIVKHGGTPIIIQTARLHLQSPREKIKCYEEICRGYDEVLCFELSPVFAANGEIFDDETIRGLIEIPELSGLKHSSLDRITEFQRLALRDQMRPEFTIYTGNDLAIDMIEYGSDYLLGLATFAPEKFAERDHRWETGDPGYYALSDALQHLGCVAFRPPVPAYKHSAAIFLNLTGRVPSNKAHSKNPPRPAWESELMRECAQRLQLM
ncbi:MAG TPA: dihydrodipicolinate synthase family protein [Pyrinomonadaceae bacterium]|nr:dihydrodipicolinate synthase family protein [Pyrinomonadaceae bacterium]